MIPIEILMLPLLYNPVVKWEIINAKSGVKLPFMMAASSVFLFRQFTSEFPLDLMGAGHMDDATLTGKFHHIMALYEACHGAAASKDKIKKYEGASA
jgi:ABC-type glycerol-3-phosphate transport system permease component